MESISENPEVIRTEAEWKDILRAKLADADIHKLEAYQDFCQKLLTQYGKEVRKYKMFHALIDSTTDDAYSPYFDLEDGVIQKFIEDF